MKLKKLEQRLTGHRSERLGVSMSVLAKMARDLGQQRLQVAHKMCHSGYTCLCQKRNCANCRIFTLLCRIAVADCELYTILKENL